MLYKISCINGCTCSKPQCPVPPSPDLVAQLNAQYFELIRTKVLPSNMDFRQYYRYWRSSRRAENFVGLDDGAIKHAPSSNAQLITRPPKILRGVIQTLVLLVDFPDKPHTMGRTPAFYEQMLFGDSGVFLNGSMREYYRGISNFNAPTGDGIDVQGKVHGWLRLPNPSSFYTDGASGMGRGPRNAQSMASDAVQVALAEGIDFSPYDNLNEGVVTALFIIHAGRGAEETGSKDDFWSLKWVVPTLIPVATGINVQTFLTVPEDCNMGVCAHEWGHLAARWADFYDTGTEEAKKSNGLGNYCLMASGTWGNRGITPTLPNGMLRMFHGWVNTQLVTADTSNISLTPAAEGGKLIRIENPGQMTGSQYILVEYRRKRSQDSFLPDEGVAIYVVDESIDNVNVDDKLAIELLQADDRHDLAKIFGRGNRGDANDLYPSLGNSSAGQHSRPPSNLPNDRWSGVTIKVRGNPGDPQMFIDVTIG